MRNPLNFIALALILLPLQAIAAPSQSPGSDTCHGRIYTASEVARRARITQPVRFEDIFKAFGRGVCARVVVEAVLCRSGRVTDIKVIEISPEEIKEFVIGAVSEISFKPAEMNWHTVSQRMRFEFQVGPIEPGVQMNTSTDAAGRLVESVDIMGNRRLTAREIRSWIKTRPGEPYNPEQIKKDFDAVLATGYFNKLQTRVFTEEGVRGGLVVVFEVAELPLIVEVKFEGLKIDQTLIFEALEKEGIFLKVGAPYDPVPIKHAARIIKQVLVSSGQGESKVEARIEQLSATKVNVVFVITSNQ
jgi:surface antigen-like variable number repeat protein/TonB-like protein